MIYNLAYDIALQAVVRVEVDAESLEQAERRALAAIEGVECADLNFSPAPGVLFTEASTCNMPDLATRKDPLRPHLFEINGECPE